MPSRQDRYPVSNRFVWNTMKGERWKDCPANVTTQIIVKRSLNTLLLEIGRYKQSLKLQIFFSCAFGKKDIICIFFIKGIEIRRLESRNIKYAVAAEEALWLPIVTYQFDFALYLLQKIKAVDFFVTLLFHYCSY